MQGPAGDIDVQTGMATVLVDLVQRFERQRERCRSDDAHGVAGERRLLSWSALPSTSLHMTP